MWLRGKFSTIVLLCQVAFIILFGVFARYRSTTESLSAYPMFQDVHVMIFVGFGFLMTFLKRYGFGAVGINFVLASIAIQWHIIFDGLLELSHNKGTIPIDVISLITADFGAAAVLISFGAVIGKTSPLQLVIMAILEICVYAVNEYIAVNFYKVADIGGSMIIHVFGAYFGLAVATVIYRKEHIGSQNEGTNYHSDIFSMIGTIFLWLFWPSFNAATATTPEQSMRAVINTYLSLAACAVVAFSMSSVTDKKAKFSMVHVQNATLAGGVAVGTTANFMLDPWAAVLIGMVAGCLSVVGYKYIQPCLAQKLNIHDSCGVNNLHGMPGLVAAVAGIIGAAIASLDKYPNYGTRTSLFDVFPAMENTTALSVTGDSSTVVQLLGRTNGEQAGYQAATLATTLALAIAGGSITGVLLRFIPDLDQPRKDALFRDGPFWEVPDSDCESVDNNGSSEAMAMKASGNGSGGEKFTALAEP